MFLRPNLNAPNSTVTTKNDLYRKFKQYFFGATEKEFRQYDSYGRAGYVSVNPAIEERILDTLDHEIDEIVPITGATGIGKTYLLLYCLKTYYDVDDIPTNHPIIFQKDGAFDLIYYSDFNITEQSILKDPTNLMLAKIYAMQECLLTQTFFPIPSEINVEDYIQKRKLEVKYYSDENVGYQKALYRLTTLLTLTPIRNIVFIFDDLESLDESEQFSLMANFLTMFENFKAKSERAYRSKFIFCLRNNTYYNIYKRDFYNTHRASKASYLSVAPPLSQIFRKRFDIILGSDKVKKAKNEATWNEARDILIKLSDRVDSSYANLLLRLNNNNISNALDDFLSIISNRRWTQKNVNPSASFKIEAGDYYINDTNILRILSMGEESVYYQRTHLPIRCILPKPGDSPQDDLIAMLVLRAFRFCNQNNTQDISIQSKLLSKQYITSQVSGCIVPRNESNITDKAKRIHKDVEDAVQMAFSYYEENRFIRKNVDPLANEETTKYFMLPRGEQIFDLFFSQSILFTIFRDAFLWDQNIYDVRCSMEISFEDLLIEAFKYQNQLYAQEVLLFNRIIENKVLRSYIATFGRWSSSESFLNGIEKSVQQYYKSNTGVPERITLLLTEAQNKALQFSYTFMHPSQENSWFD